MNAAVVGYCEEEEEEEDEKEEVGQGEKDGKSITASICAPSDFMRLV